MTVVIDQLDLVDTGGPAPAAVPAPAGPTIEAIEQAVGEAIAQAARRAARLKAD